MQKVPSPSLKIGDQLQGFVVRKITPLPEVGILAYELEHLQSGAKMLHLHNEDNENLFSINFATPPADDTGLPHILEHAVLGGSQRFPVRDPFFEMIKMSMATFINAMTGKDCTYYPVSSNVRADLFNLAEVYFDAVFHPLLEEDTFRREGHHLAPANPAEPLGALTINGIVYNEMKAYDARPEVRLWRDVCRSILPDTSYGYDSGGDPRDIPDLTYEQFVDFHRRYYHPSNAYIVTYGDIEVEAFLSFLGSRLDKFQRQPSPASFSHQPDWSEPRSQVQSYNIGADESTDGKTFLQIAWKMPGLLATEELLYLQVLQVVLLGDDAAPLKRAIIDSGLGRDLVNSGFLLAGKDSVFGIGIKGSEAERMAAFRQLVFETLSGLVANGIPRELVETAFLRHTYALREIVPTRPLHVATSAVDPWILGGDPLSSLRLGEVMDKCRQNWEQNPAILTDLIDKYLLQNQHRLELSLVPDREWLARTEAALNQKLTAARATLTDDAARKLAEDAARMVAIAGTPNSPAALATLPQLKRSDLPAEPTFAAVSQETLADVIPFMRNDVFANGVNYLNLRFDLEGLDPGLWSYLPLYVQTIDKMGAAGKDFAAMARRRSASMGDFGCVSSFADHAIETDRTTKSLVFSLKTLDSQVEAALDVLSDLLCTPDHSDRKRLKDVVVQICTGLRTSLVSAGHATAVVQAQSGLTEAGYLQERVGGLSWYRLISGLEKNFDEAVEAATTAVLKIAATLRNRKRMMASFTGGDTAAAKVQERLTSLAAGFASDPVEARDSGFRPFAGVPRLGFAAPMEVAHCAQVIPSIHRSDPDWTLLNLGMALLRIDYMIQELRFKGNAYGASCVNRSRAIILSTYADPHIRRTLEVFRGIAAYIRDVPWSDVEVTRAVLSTAKTFVTPLRPEAVTLETLANRVAGVTNDRIRERYEMLKAATPQAIRRALLAVIEPGLDKAPVAVVSSREKLTAANLEMADQPLKLESLLE